MLTVLFLGLGFLVGVPVGAYSHKYLASEVQTVTGFNPNVHLQSPLAPQASSVKPAATLPPVPKA